jgi:hypothetical protein
MKTKLMPVPPAPRRRLGNLLHPGPADQSFTDRVKQALTERPHPVRTPTAVAAVRVAKPQPPQNPNLHPSTHPTLMKTSLLHLCLLAAAFAGAHADTIRTLPICPPDYPEFPKPVRPCIPLPPLRIPGISSPSTVRTTAA